MYNSIPIFIVRARVYIPRVQEQVFKSQDP